MSVTKLSNDIQSLSQIDKINEIIDALNTGVTITVDDEISSSSENPVQNKVIASALSGKQDTLIAGDNITIENGTISSSGTTYTAGDNITISNGTISATDTTYEAGEGISIENGTISSTQTSAEWGSITGTLSEQTDLNTALQGKQDALVAGNGISIVNNTISATESYSYSASCPAITPVDGVCTWQITHNLGTQDIMCTLFYGNTEISKDMIITSNNAITLTFKNDTAVNAGDYRAVVFSSGGFNANIGSDDGWIKCNYSVFPDDTHVAQSDRVFSLSGLLPNDNYAYEVIFDAYAVAPVNTYFMFRVTTSLVGDVAFFANNNNTSKEMTLTSTACLPIGTDRNITVYGAQYYATTVSLVLYARAYRKVGNSNGIETANLALKNLSNIDDSAKVIISNTSAPSTIKVDMAKGASDTTYTAPVTGWVMAQLQNVSNFAELYISRSDFYGVKTIVYDNWTRAMLFVKKGDNYTIRYNNGGTLGMHSIFCTVGSAHEYSPS